MAPALWIRVLLKASTFGLVNVGALTMLLLLSSCGTKTPASKLVKIQGPQRFDTVIQPPLKLTSIESGERDRLGRPTRVACATCHSQRGVTNLPSAPGELDEFHGGLKLRHGSLACSSCHISGGRTDESLHLANGNSIPMTDVMTLCAQCHGPQFRDYRRGAHGGMNGYWDLRQGPRTRNNCVECHDPHTPQIPKVMPVLPPRDRYFKWPSASEVEH